MGFERYLLRIVSVALCALSLTASRAADAPPQSRSHIILSFEGVGPIKIGTACTRLTQAGYEGCSGRDRDGTPDSSAYCVDLRFFNKDPQKHVPEKHQLGAFGAQIRNGRVQRIDITPDANPANDFTVVTVEGIHLHSPEDDVRIAYRGRALEGLGSIYGITQLAARPGERHAFLLKSDDGQRGLLIETAGGEVIAMHVGVIRDFYVVRANGAVTIEAPDCVSILEGPPRGPASYP
jgi:hypothetical protein